MRHGRRCFCADSFHPWPTLKSFETGDDVLAANARARTPHSHGQGSVRWPSPPMLGWGFDPSVMQAGDKGDAD
jgi:hypothetical protein